VCAASIDERSKSACVSMTGAGVFRSLVDTYGGAFDTIVFPIHERGTERTKRAAFDAALGSLAE